MLANNPFFYEEQTLPIPLSDEQRLDRQERNTEIDLDLGKAKDQLDLAKAVFKAATEKIKEEKKKILCELKQGFVDTVVKVAEFPDEDRGIITYMDEGGTQVYVRDMTPKERRQYKIKFNKSSI